MQDYIKTPSIKTPGIKTPSLLRSLACLLYESLLLIAIGAAAIFLFLIVLGDATQAPKRYILQVYLWLVFAIYFIWCWCKSGQTLAMQTWHIKLINHSGNTLTFPQACRRYILATVFFGAGFIWALFDREGQFLHDRLSGCKLRLLEKRR